MLETFGINKSDSVPTPLAIVHVKCTISVCYGASNVYDEHAGKSWESLRTENFRKCSETTGDASENDNTVGSSMAAESAVAASPR